jgi:periplasmic divalent cation tolerance protein
MNQDSTPEIRIVLSTAKSRDEAERIARTLVERHLAACVNLVPGLTSIYRWQGSVEEAQEVLLLIKTSSAKLQALEEALSELHSYEVPEFVVLPVESASESYLAWVLAAVAS